MLDASPVNISFTRATDHDITHSLTLCSHPSQREYYNSHDVDAFYRHALPLLSLHNLAFQRSSSSLLCCRNVWGSEDLHIGQYNSNSGHDTTTIRNASRATVSLIASKISSLEHTSANLLDIGAGYGGASRSLARDRGYRVTCVNISETQNQRNRSFVASEGLSDRVDVIDGDFQSLPIDDHSFDAVLCIDSILHAGDRFQVFKEVDRVLKPGGAFVFSGAIVTTFANPMTSVRFTDIMD